MHARAVEVYVHVYIHDITVKQLVSLQEIIGLFGNYAQKQMFDGGNFDEFDESKLPRQNFPINILHFNKIF